MIRDGGTAVYAVLCCHTSAGPALFIACYKLTRWNGSYKWASCVGAELRQPAPVGSLPVFPNTLRKKPCPAEGSQGLRTARTSQAQTPDDVEDWEVSLPREPSHRFRCISVTVGCIFSDLLFSLQSTPHPGKHAYDGTRAHWISGPGLQVSQISSAVAGCINSIP